MPKTTIEYRKDYPLNAIIKLLAAREDASKIRARIRELVNKRLGTDFDDSKFHRWLHVDEAKRVCPSYHIGYILKECSDKAMDEFTK